MKKSKKILIWQYKKKQRMERRIKIGMRIANEKMSNYTVIKESVTFGGKEMNPALLFSLFWSQAGNLLIKLCSR